MRTTESIKHYVIAMENGEEFIFEEDKDAADEKFLELHKEDKDAISQYYSKEWIKYIPSEEETLEGYEEEIEEGEVDIFFESGDVDISIAPALIEADKSLSIILGEYPNFHISGSVQGMRDQFYGQSAFLVKCGEYIYKVPEDIYSSIKDGVVGDWTKTDDNQLCIELVNNNYSSLFGMINIAKDNSSYLLGLEIIEIDPEEDLESDISSYYDSVEDIKREYGDKWLQIVAECILENNFIHIPKIRFYSLEALNEHLKDNGIEYELYV